MAVVRAGVAEIYSGLSGDSKPTGVPAGSLFHETDTLTSYIYDGTAWSVIATGTPAFTGRWW